jgi:hypothetical protein
MKEERSLWEIYDSETELWRRGRVILVLIALFYFLTQSLVILGALFIGSLERVWYSVSPLLSFGYFSISSGLAFIGFASSGARGTLS